MKYEIIKRRHPLFNGEYFYLMFEGITVSIWYTYGAAVEAMLNRISPQDQIFNSFID